MLGLSAAFSLGATTLGYTQGMDELIAHEEILDVRLSQLERSCKRLRSTLAMTLVSGCALVCLAWTSGMAVVEDLRAKRFTLIGGDGKICAELRTDAGEPSLILFDRRGNKRLTAKISDDDPYLTLADTKKRVRLGLSIDGEGNPHLALMDEAPKIRLHLATGGEGGHGNIRFISSDGMTPAGLGLMPDGSPWLRPSKDFAGGNWGRPNPEPTNPEPKAKRGK